MTGTAAGDAIDLARIEADIRTLIRFPSITGSEEAIQAEMERLFREIGLETARIETDPVAFAADPDFPGAEMPRTSLPVVTARMGRAGGRRLLLVGHVDVVPPGDLATWSAEPWGGEVRDGAMFGRGACDMKGGVVAILAALRALVATGAADGLVGEVLAVSVPSEEDGGQGMLAAIRAGCTGDAAIITEPTGLDVVIAHAGAITFRLTVPGRAAHASVRREGVSALDNLYTLIRALEADEAARNAAERDPLMTALGLPYPTIIGKVEGGEWASTVLDRVVAEGRYGVKLGQDVARRGSGPAVGGRRGLCRGSVPARASRCPSPRDHRRQVLLVARPGGSPAAGGAGGGRGGDPRPATGPPR